MIILLTKTDGDSVYVNINKVGYFQACAKGTLLVWSTVDITPLQVVEKPSEVAKRIDDKVELTDKIAFK